MSTVVSPGVSEAPGEPQPQPQPGATHARELVLTHRRGPVTVHALPDPSRATALDLLVETVCDLLDVDYAGVHLVDADVHQVLACTDPVPHPPLPRSDSLCGVLLDEHLYDRDPATAPPAEIVEVCDVAAHPGLPTARVGSAPIRFYAGTPLFDAHGRARGTLCAIAHHPRTLSPVERRAFVMMGLAASRLITGCGGPLEG